MNKINPNIIEEIVKFLNIWEYDSFRQSAKEFSMTVGKLYFSNINFDAHAIKKYGAEMFDQLVNKYTILIKLYIGTNETVILSKIQNTNIQKIHFLSNSLSECEYFLSQLPKITHLKKLELNGSFNLPIRKNNLPTTLQSLVLGSKFFQPINDLPDGLLCLKIYGKQSID